MTPALRRLAMLVELPDFHLELPVLFLALVVLALGAYVLAYHARGLSRWSSVFLLFSLAAVVQTWPLVLHAVNGLMDWPFFPFDGWYYLWSFWWIKHALLTLHTSPLHTDLLLYPQGAALDLQLPLVSGVLSIPLQVTTGNLLLSSNVLGLLSLVVSGLGMYALAYRVTGNHVAAVLSGYIFAFSPFILMHAPGHWNVSATWPIPFFVLFLVRFQETGRLRDAAGAGVFWAVLTYNWLEFSADAGMFLGIFLAYWAVVYVRRKDQVRLSSHWRGFAVILTVWIVLSAPLLIPALLQIGSGELYRPPSDESYSADLLTFFTPSSLWGPGMSHVFGGQVPPYFHFPVGAIENTAYLGGVPLLLGSLTLLAVRRTPHRSLLWLLTFLFFAILALGPYLYVDGTKSLSLLGVSFSLPMPYKLYQQLPVFGERRVPARMIVFGIMALSVLAGVGLDLVISWLKPRYRQIVPLAGFLALGLVVLEFWNPPVFISEYPSPPAILEQIAAEPGQFAVLDVPLGRRSGFDNHGHDAAGPLANYYETFHHKAAVAGYVARINREEFAWILDQPGLHYLTCYDPCPRPNPSNADSNPDLVRSLFRQLRIKYAILHRTDPFGHNLAFVGDEQINLMDAYLRDVAGMMPVYSDSEMTVYRNPEVTDGEIQGRADDGSIALSLWRLIYSPHE